MFYFIENVKIFAIYLNLLYKRIIGEEKCFLNIYQETVNTFNSCQWRITKRRTRAN